MEPKHFDRRQLNLGRRRPAYTEADIRALRLSPLVGRGVMFTVESKTDIDTTSQ
jgi:hypothetical protein